MSSAGGIKKGTYVAALKSLTAEGGRADRISRVECMYESKKAVLYRVVHNYSNRPFLLVFFCVVPATI